MNELRPVSAHATRAPEIRGMDKSPDAFRTISEVAEDLDLPQHVLRFWETRFPQIKPLKRGGRRRYYRPDDIDLLRGIRHLLYGQGYTIKGVQRILKQEGSRVVQSIGRGERTIAAPIHEMSDEAYELDSFEAEPAVPVGMAPAEDAGFRSVGSALEPMHICVAYPSSEARAGPALSPGDVQRLRAALDELVECERVLAGLSFQDE